jgi:hypothetical protein
MAALTDATVVTRELLERTHELRRHVDGGEADFKVMALVAEGIAERADALAATFADVDEVLTRSPFIHRVSEASAEPAAQPSEAEVERSPRLRPRLAALLLPARWLGRRLRDVWQILVSRTPYERPELA